MRRGCNASEPIHWLLGGRASFAGRRMDDERQDDGGHHDASDHVKTAAIASAGLSQVSDEQWAEGTGKTPRREHEPINRPYVFRAEVVRCERGRGSETTPIAH